MSCATDRCMCCNTIRWEMALSKRGWCEGCEKEFARVVSQLAVRRESVKWGQLFVSREYAALARTESD